MKLAERFHRWRATKGYGVHSPSAFRLIRHAIRPRRDVIYYGEEILEDLSSESDSQAARGKVRKIQLSRARILLRMVAELQPSYVWISPGLPALYTEAIRLAGGVIRVYDGAIFPDEISMADMVVLHDCNPKKSELRKIITPGRSLAAFGINHKTALRVEELLKGGVLLEAVDSLFAVCTRDEAAHVYRISNI